MKIYVASSWRNAQQPEVVARLRADGHEVYDFRHPAPGVSGFAWSQIDPEWQGWNPAAFAKALRSPVAQDGFNRDMDALRSCDACVYVRPCGVSASLELGWAAGAGKLTIVLLAPGEPELMFLMATAICTTLDQVSINLTAAGFMMRSAAKRRR
jgi:hypothetical protein